MDKKTKVKIIFKDFPTLKCTVEESENEIRGLILDALSVKTDIRLSGVIIPFEVLKTSLIYIN